jgi:ABC-type multidrug transport system fused ATPase/permease subunit
VESSALGRLRRDFSKARLERWGAILSSVLSAFAFLFLLVLLYLFADLLVWQGRIPQFDNLSAARQKAFETDWARRGEGDREEAAARACANPAQARRVAEAESSPAPTHSEWELRWRAGTYLTLRDRIGQHAANAALPEPSTEASGRSPELGILSLAARAPDSWSGRLAAWIASWNSWTWHPGSRGSANLTYLTGLFILAFGVALARGVLVNAVSYLAAAVALDFLTRLRRGVYLHTYRLGPLAVRTVGSAEAVHLFTKQTDLVGAAENASLRTSYRCPILVFGILAFILILHFWLAISFLLLAALVWLVIGQIAAHFRREARLGSRSGESSLALLVESIGLLHLVKCYQMERFNQNRVERQLAEAGRSGWRKLRGEALAAPLLGSVALVAGIAMLYLAARSVLAGEFSVAGLTAMAVALVSLATPIAEWVDSRRKLRRGREAAEAIIEFLDRRGEAPEAADAEYLPALRGRMEFRAVTVKEPGTGRNLLDNVTFAVPAESRVAVVGPDAAAKRALVYLIPRFLDPSSGEIRIEEKNIRWVTHESLRAQVALVMQDDLTFSDTVANNIGCGDPQYNLPQIIEAAKLAHAHQFIEKLPYGYETLIGGHGRSLKPGEQFRIGLARALLRDPSILIIEEPSGPVDEDTLALLDDTMERASHGRMIIFLASRLSTLRSVDRVFLLRDGRLDAAGSHRDLWQHNEYYRRLQMVADATAESVSLKE